MLHIVLALDVIALALSVCVIAISLFAYNFTGKTPFRFAAATFVAALLLMLASAFKTYNRLSGGVFGATLPWLTSILTVAGYGMSGYVMPLAAYSIFKPITRRLIIPHFAIAVLLAGLGALQEMAPSRAASSIGMGSLAGLHVYSYIVFLFACRALQPEDIRPFLRWIAVFIGAILCCLIADTILRNTPYLPPVLREYPLVQIAYLLGMAVLLIVFSAWYQLKYMVQNQIELPEQFILKYAISPRESEIVHMILQGYSNRVIGEKLFISAMTVKNHVYNIYKKTGVSNKVQLFNLINRHK